MDTSQELQNQEITETFTKTLFPTQLRCFSYPLTQTLVDDLITFANENQCFDITTVESDVGDQFKSIVYEVCQKLEEFSSGGQIPRIIGSNLLFQQVHEHIPLHAYEDVPLVLSFVINNGQNPNFTYFADTRGAVQTLRNRIYNNLVGTSYGLKLQVGEVVVTPGYVQRYHETNLSDQTQVILNVLVGFSS